MKHYSIVFDGGAIGNPGQGYGSFEISGPGNLCIRERMSYSDQGERVTNNEAEYMTLIKALERLLELVRDDPKKASVTIHGDSMLVINQVNGIWKIKKPHLKLLHDEAINLIAWFGEANLKWHSRTNSVWVLGH